MSEQVFAVTELPRVAWSASPAVRAWAGRVTLWSVTLTLACAGLAVPAAAAWLLTPPGRADWLEGAFRALVAGSLGSGLAAFLMLFCVHRWLVPPRDAEYRPLDGARVHVGLTAWNDEASIGAAVRDFKACRHVHKVVVVDNNSSDGTARAARDAGADEVVIETVPGYGSCCLRALDEASRGADVVILCEGDMTFAAGDVKKFLAYLENCDFTLGTRATQELRDADSQMDWLLNPGNQVVAKLVQTRFWGTRLTDMGCTYRALRVDSYRRLRPRLKVLGNHFSPHMFIEALQLGQRVLEIPVFFRARVGESKGVGSNKVKAAKVALKMLGLVYRA